MDLASLLTGENAAWIDQQYTSWLSDPSSVAPEWSRWFETWEGPKNGAIPGARPAARPRSIFAGGPTGHATSGPEALEAARRQAKVAQLINAYRVRGHSEADIDPLGKLERGRHPELTLSYYGLSEADLDMQVVSEPLFGVPRVCTLRQVVDHCRKAWCGSFGVEFMNIAEPHKKRWLQERVEMLPHTDVLSGDDQRYVLRLLSDAEGFERVLHNRFPGTKRFSCEGSETLIPLLKLLVEELGARGVREVIIGMAHRGRLNVLGNILGKPVRQIVNEFEDVQSDTFQGSGDVKYHLGYSRQHSTRKGDELWLSLAFNPSHLEAVDPVVEGRVRARQDLLGDSEHVHVAPILIHGDAAFAGQGLVAEVFNLSGTHGYKTGGTVHVVINNQIGFTTSSAESRSTPYCTDIARMLAVPIFHVNGEDPRTVTAIVRIAAEWRQTFHEDVIIDLYGFRKWGHNEGDEPSFTQPLLYKAIRSHPSPREVYAQQMIQRGELSKADVDRIFAESTDRLQQELEGPAQSGWDSYEGAKNSQIGQLWVPYLRGSLTDEVDTRVPRERLSELLLRANMVPDDFAAHRKIRRLLKNRQEMAVGERPVDWGTAEQAAYATLVAEGSSVRISGEDCGRGTFSHRHAALTDIRTGSDYFPLQHVAEGQGRFEVYDSLLSEFGVLGFEFGYSLEAPETLTIWEAQFGDFANGAQVIIDNFVMATEQKWNRKSGLVMLLPHGYEGQGPEHSSARLERYLQLCAEENITVANCTTPASFYHLLRRQQRMRTRKPLIVMSPKSLLRHAQCISTLDELAEGAFRPVLGDDFAHAEQVERVVFCSGKVYYDLFELRAERDQRRVALARLEQLYPFPAGEVVAELSRYSDSAEVVWCQEEPRNMGAWPMMDEWMGEVLGGRPPRYVGRRRAASPATGSARKHRAETQALLDEALTL